MANIAPAAQINPDGGLTLGPVQTFLPNGRFQDSAQLSDGRVVVISSNYSTSAGLKGQLYLANGTPSGASFDVAAADVQLPSFGLPVVTALADGGFAVTWAANSTASDSSGGAIATRTFAASGAASSSVVTVNTATAGAQTIPKVVATGDGGYFVAWNDASAGVGGASGDASGLAVKGQFLTATGAKVGGELLINTTTAGTQGLSDVAITSDGRIVVSWSDYAAGQYQPVVRAQLLSASGTFINAEMKVNVTAGAYLDSSDVTALRDGNFAITWRRELIGNDNDDVAVRFFRSDGTPLTGELTADLPGYDRLGESALLANGNFVVTWNDGISAGAGETMARLYTSSGVEIGSRITVGASYGDLPTVTALTDGGFAVGWTRSTNQTQFGGGPGLIQVRTFDGSGNSGTPVTTVFSDTYDRPALTALAGGNFLVGYAGNTRTVGDAFYTATAQQPLNLKGTLATSDPDAGSGIVTATLAISFGTLEVTAGTSGATVSGSGTASVTVTGTVAQIDALLRTDGSSTVRYIVGSNTPPSTAALSFTVNDNGNSGGPAQTGSDTAVIAIRVNQAPVVTVTAATLNVTEAATSTTTAAIIDPGITVADSDSATLTRITARFVSGYDPTQDRLGIGASSNSTMNFDVATGTLTLTGSFTVADAQGRFRTWTYQNLSDVPTGQTRVIEFSVDDGISASTPVTRAVTITPTNDAPLIDLNGAASGINGAVAYLRGGPAIRIAPDASLVDDNANLNNGILTVAPQAASDADARLTVATTGSGADQVGVSGSSVTYGGTVVGNISGGAGTDALVVTFNAAATPAAAQAILRAISYANAGPDVPPQGPTYRVTLFDGAGATSAPAITTITISDPNAPLFGPATTSIHAYSADLGWSQNIYPRAVADVNGDGRADIVGFGWEGVYLTLGTGSGFATTQTLASTAFGRSPQAGSWLSNDLYYRTMGDVNGDGRADIVGFGDDGTYVSISNGTTFATPYFAVRSFGKSVAGGSWTDANSYPRLIADVNGDGRGDIVGFGDDKVYVALMGSNGQFGSPIIASDAFARSAIGGGWTSQDRYPRALGDVNGDGRADLVGFGEGGVWTALANANGTFATPTFVLHAFGRDDGWSSQDLTPRAVADVNGDGRADLIGFNTQGTVVALSNGDGSFAAPKLALSAFGPGAGAGNWNGQDAYTRVFADMNGDKSADIVGFGSHEVIFALSAGPDLIP